LLNPARQLSHPFGNAPAGLIAPPLRQVQPDRTVQRLVRRRHSHGGTGDACVELGPHVGYNKKSHEMTVQAVKEFLASRFKLKQ
jgi:hypothetical protein